MHEQALLRQVVARAVERCREEGGAKVRAVEIVLGAGGHLTESAARLHFGLAARGTAVEGARLRIRWRAARYRCIDCAEDFSSVAPASEVACPSCGGMAVPFAPADDLRLKRVEVEAR